MSAYTVTAFCLLFSEEEEAPLLTPRLLRLRRTLPELQVAEEVLARFSDDGWYYRGTAERERERE